ncbi:hypothetical protein GQR58_008284 [Nymphon striatum]|nr:hypothetical protein GQR58_008284 [Nymphon striatum]
MDFEISAIQAVETTFGPGMFLPPHTEHLEEDSRTWSGFQPPPQQSWLYLQLRKSSYPMTVDVATYGKRFTNHRFPTFQNIQFQNMDWNLCVICQERGGDLRCPTDSLQKNGLEVYKNFLETVDKFSELGILPVDVDFKEVAIAETFLENHAKWHKSCHIKFARSKLQRAQKQIEVKQKREEEVSGEGRQSKRQSIGNPNQKACIFCLTVSGKMHKCLTMNLDHELRRWATELNDTALLARISGGDLVAIEAKYHYDCLSLYKNRHRSVTEVHREQAIVMQPQMKADYRRHVHLLSLSPILNVV